jgi:Holliday junction resolvase-like predicted endonuclease
MGCTNLLDQLAEVRASPRSTSALGSFGEAAAEVFLAEVLGHEIVADEATRDKPQGIDLVTYDAEHDRIVVVEVKATGLESALGPKLAKTTTTRQMSDRWIASGGASPSGVSRAAEVGLESVRGEDVGHAVARMVAWVNVGAGTVSLHEMDGDRVQREATTTVGLDDLVRFSDALRDRS